MNIGRDQINIKEFKGKFNTGSSNNPVSDKSHEKSNSIKRLTDSATLAAFAGFLVVEIGTYLYPISYNHIISVIIGLFVFAIVAIFNKH